MGGLGRTVGAAALLLSGVLIGHEVSSVDIHAGTAGALQATSAPVAADAATISAFDKVSPAVVQVVSVGVGSGSGVIYDNAGDIVTNNHVVAGATHWRVQLVDGRTLPATLVGTDPADDLAVLHVRAANLPVATFGDSHQLRTAQQVLAIGNPLGLQQTVTSGLVSATGRTVEEPTSPNGLGGAYLPDAIQTSAPINPGNSGGALVALDGTVVGIPTLVATDPQLGSQAQGIGFAVSSARVREVAPQLIRYGKVLHTGRAYLGAVLCDAQAGCPDLQGVPDTGVAVDSLSSTGPLARAGVQQGDVITAINGRAVNSRDDVLTILAQRKPGDHVTLTVNSGGQTTHVRVRLGELPAQ